MVRFHLIVAWIAILAGMLSGAWIGLFFHNAGWWGGYASWRRRMARLGHIALVGLGLVNLAFAATLQTPGAGAGAELATPLLLVGTVTMPGVCFLSAWREAFRHLFFIPVTSLIAAVAIVLVRGLGS